MLRDFTASLVSSALSLRLIDCAAPVSMLSHSIIIAAAAGVASQAATALRSPIRNEYVTMIAILGHNRLQEILSNDEPVHSWSGTVFTAMVSVPLVYLISVFGVTLTTDLHAHWQANKAKRTYRDSGEKTL